MRGSPPKKKKKREEKQLPEDAGVAKIKLEPEGCSQQRGDRGGFLNTGDTESLKGTIVESLDSFLHVH